MSTNNDHLLMFYVILVVAFNIIKYDASVYLAFLPW